MKEFHPVENINFRLLKVGEIAGIHYKSPFPTDAVVVYGIGAPIPPDNGHLPDVPIILAHNIDIFVPDYIGYGRSDGIFTPENCIKTFTNLQKSFSEGCSGFSGYEDKQVPLQYKRIIYIERNFGGTYVPVLPRFNEDIKELAIFCPVVDSKSCGSIPGEETNESFFRSMKEDGYYHLYRGILDERWTHNLENEDDLSPMDNIRHLKNARLFIGHGQKDQVVHYSKSVEYYRRLLSAFSIERINSC